MQAGDSHIDYSCPGCGKLFCSVAEHAGRDARCPDCETTFTIPSPVPAPGGQPTRSRYADRFGGERPRTPSSGTPGRAHADGPVEPARWPNNWAIIWGVALLFAIFMPLPKERWVSSGGRYSPPVEEIEWVFIWDVLDEANSETVVAVLASICVGLLAIIAGAAMRGEALGHTLFWTLMGVFLLNMVLLEFWEILGKAKGDATTAVIVGVLMMFAIPVIAAGNHVRKFHPHASAPRSMAGIGGIVLVVGMILPIVDSHPMIEALFHEEPWEEAPALMACGVAFVIYAILALASFTPGRIQGLTLTMSVLARCIMIGLPVLAVVTAMTENNPSNFGIVFIIAMKVSLALYGQLALMAVGLAAMAGSGAGQVKHIRPYG